MADSMTVELEQGLCMFKLPLDTGECACLQYRIEEGSGIWDCYHTEVPQSQQGKGIGGVLAKALFTHAKENGVKLRLTCSYLVHYLKKHPEYSDLVVG